MQFQQFLASHFTQKSSKLVLPFIAMAQKSKLQWRVIQEHKINIEHCLLFLEVIGNFCVPCEFQKKLINLTRLNNKKMVKSVENEGNIVEPAWSMDDKQLIKIKSDYLTIGSYVSVRSSRYEARGKFGEHERYVRVAQGVAESNSSFLLSNFP